VVKFRVKAEYEDLQMERRVGIGEVIDVPKERIEILRDIGVIGEPERSEKNAGSTQT
jgi:hypothetical protein